MNRRELMLLAGAVMVPRSVGPRQKVIPVIGFLSSNLAPSIRVEGRRRLAGLNEAATPSTGMWRSDTAGAEGHYD
jgi:hypothetical protein